MNSTRLIRHRDCKVDSSIGPSESRRMTRARAAFIYPFTTSKRLERILTSSEKRDVKASKHSKTSGSRFSRVLINESRSNRGRGWQSQYKRYNSAAATISSHGGSVFVLAKSAQSCIGVWDILYLLGGCDILSKGEEEIIIGIASLGTD